MIDQILLAVKGTFQADPTLAEVTTYHLVDGMIPSVKTTISIGCYEIKYNDYDRDQDEVTASIRVWLYLHSIKPEDGENQVRQLTQQLRYSLLADMYLGGLVDASTVKSIAFDTEQANLSQTLYYAMLDYEVKYYESRNRTEPGVPTAVDIQATLNSETIDIEL